MRGRAIRIRTEHASNSVFNYIPHGARYSGQSFGVVSRYFSLPKLCSVVSRSTLELIFFIYNPLKIFVGGGLSSEAKVDSDHRIL